MPRNSTTLSEEGEAPAKATIIQISPVFSLNTEKTRLCEPGTQMTDAASPSAQLQPGLRDYGVPTRHAGDSLTPSQLDPT